MLVNGLPSSAAVHRKATTFDQGTELIEAVHDWARTHLGFQAGKRVQTPVYEPLGSLSVDPSEPSRRPTRRIETDPGRIAEFFANRGK